MANLICSYKASISPFAVKNLYDLPLCLDIGNANRGGTLLFFVRFHLKTFAGHFVWRIGSVVSAINRQVRVIDICAVSAPHTGLVNNANLVCATAPLAISALGANIQSVVRLIIANDTA